MEGAAPADAGAADHAGTPMVAELLTVESSSVAAMLEAMEASRLVAMEASSMLASPPRAREHKARPGARGGRGSS